MMQDLSLMQIQLSPQHAPPPGPARRKGRARPALAPARRIAIVEDELMVAWSLESTVEDMGCAVVGIFPDADSVLAALLERPAELILMDINLGGGPDGVDTARSIRATYAIPVIFISAYADPAMRARIAEAIPGAPLLRKPVQAADLEAALRTALDPPN